MVEIRSRAQWGAARARDVTRVPRSRRTEFFVHHTTGEALGAGSTPEWLRSIQAYHKGPKGWSDIGYNLIVDDAGTAWEGRGWDVQGAHCTGHNVQGVGVALLGDGARSVSLAALATIGELHKAAEALYGRPLPVLGHRDAAKTACPGDALYGHLSMLGQDIPVAVGSVVHASPLPEELSPFTKPAPKYPLPGGYVFGPKNGGRRIVSGHYNWSAELRVWQQRMSDRGWSLDVDGLYGDQTAGTARLFQAEKGLKVDGLIGPLTWQAAWEAPLS